MSESAGRATAAQAAITRWIDRHYRGGASVRQLARHLGRSYGFVHSRLDLAGTPRRRQGRPDFGSAVYIISDEPGGSS